MAKDRRDIQKRNQTGLDSGWAWVVMASACFTYLVLGGHLYSTGLVQTALLQRYGKSISATSWAGSLFMSLSNLAGPVGTVLIDKTDCRRAQMVAGVLMAMGFLLTAFASNLETCIFGCGVLSGVGSGISFSVCFTVPGFNFRKHLNLVMGMVVAGGGVGMCAMAPLMEYIREKYGYHAFFVFLSSVSLQLVVIGALMRPSRLETELKATRDMENKAEHGLLEPLASSMKSYSKLLVNKYVVCLAVSHLLYNGGNYISYLVWPRFCLSKGLTPMQSALVISVSGAVYIVGRILTGIVASSKHMDERVLFSGFILVHSGFLFLFQLYSDYYIGHMVTSVLVGLVNGTPWVLLTMLNAKYIGVDYLSRANGIEMLFAGIGPLVISTIAAIMIEANCTYEQIFNMCGGALLVAAVVGIAPMLCDKKGQTDTDADIEETVVLNSP